MYIRYYEDTGVVIGAMLLCLEDGQLLPNKELDNIVKEVSKLDTKKGKKIILDPRLIEEETSFFTFNRIYRQTKAGYILTNRELAERYCGSYMDDNLKKAVTKIINQKNGMEL